MDEEGDVTCAKFLDKEMGEKIIIARKVLNFHDFGRTPFCPDWLLVSGREMGINGHLGWQWGGGEGEGREEMR